MKKALTTLLFLTLATTSLTPLFGQDNQPASSPAAAKLLALNQARWEKLSPGDQGRIKIRYQAWGKLSPEDKKQLETKYQRFLRLPAEDQQSLQKKFKQLPPAIKQKLPDRQKKMARMNPDRRRVFNRMNKILGRLPPATHQKLKELSPPARRLAIRQIMENVFVNQQKLTRPQQSTFRKFSSRKRWQTVKQWLQGKKINLKKPASKHNKIKQRRSDFKKRIQRLKDQKNKRESEEK